MKILNWLLKYWPYPVLVGGAFGTWYAVRLDQIMHTRSRYTIGHVTGSVYIFKSGKKYHYRYQVQGQEYKATDTWLDSMNTNVGARFVVEYDTLDPEVSTAHFSVSIPDSIQHSPLNGWRTLHWPVSARALNYGRPVEEKEE